MCVLVNLCITLSNTQLEDMCAKIGCRQSKNNSGPIKQEACLLHPLPVILTSIFDVWVCMHVYVYMYGVCVLVCKHYGHMMCC